MEKLDAVLTAITTVGFPIVMCGAMFWYMIKQSKEHHDEVNSLKDCIDNMRVTMQELIDSIRTLRDR